MKTLGTLQEAVDAFSVEVLSTLEKKDTAVIALPGGRSIVPFLKEIQSLAIPWAKTHWFMVDERAVPIDHPDSNYGQAQKDFFSAVDAHGYPFTSTGNLSEDVQKYNEDFASVGGVFDICLVGVGEDGHIASLFPHHELLESRSSTFLSIKDSPKPPPQRVTASPVLISGATSVFVFFVGEAKQDAYEAFIDDEIDTTSCPAKITLTSRNLYVIRLH